MGDIAKSVLGGAWTLLVGWVLPTAINLSVFFLAVAPSLQQTAIVTSLWPQSKTSTALLLLVAALLLGLVLSALQNPLYRVLEGYLLWPGRAYSYGCRRSRLAKKDISDRLILLRLERREGEGTLSTTAAPVLAALRSAPRLQKAAQKDRRRSAVQRALLREQLARYPADDNQVAPTRLGNAIRRFEEYGYDRFRLDTQVIWHELIGTAPEEIRRQVDLARANVDFFVAFLFGHVAVAVTALVTLSTTRADVLRLSVTAAVLGCLLPVWYRSAVAATDEWAAAVRALVNVGRKPLADSLGLVLPRELEAERAMWTLVAKFSRLPYKEQARALDAYRAEPTTSAT